VRDKFILSPKVTFLNHGSFGACPKPVFEKYRSHLNRIDFETGQVRLDLNDYKSYLYNYELFGNKT